MKKIYSEVHFNWVELNFDKHQKSEQMARAFEDTFNIPMTASKMRGFHQRLNLRRDREHTYTLEQDEWLRNHHETKSFTYLAEDFNELFNSKATSVSISQHCRQHLKLKCQDPNKFNNSIAWNKVPTGTERNSRDGVKVKTEHNNWVNKARYIYEKHNGVVGKGYQIIQLDGDKNNFNLENLIKVPRKYMLMLNRNKWLGKGEVSRTAIKFCELSYVLKEREANTI